MHGDIEIGQVSTRDGARDHLNEAGRAHCGAGRGTIIPTTSRPLHNLAAAAAHHRLCRRCRPAIIRAIEAAAAAEAAADTGYRDTVVQALSAVADAIEPAAVREATQARHAALAARINAAFDATSAEHAQKVAADRAQMWDAFERHMAADTTPTPAAVEAVTADPDTVLVQVGTGSVRRPRRPLSGFGMIAAAHAAAN